MTSNVSIKVALNIHVIGSGTQSYMYSNFVFENVMGKVKHFPG